jgi:hypothetical protein
MLRNDMVERTTGIIKIEDFDMDVVKAMVDYIYAAKIDEKFGDLKALMRIGDKYEIQSLVDVCRKTMIDSISSANVVELGVYAENYADKEILAKCCEFIANDLDALGDNWEERVRVSPEFAISILKSLKQAHRSVTMSRFSMFSDGCSWKCDGTQRDSISFETNRPSKLAEIGLFGTKIKENIPVKINVKKGSTTVFSEDLFYKSTGNNAPIKFPLPVQVPIDPDSDYTVLALIKPAVGSTFQGVKGKEDVEGYSGGGNMFNVCFVDIDDESASDVEVGQIAILVFKV